LSSAAEASRPATNLKLLAAAYVLLSLAGIAGLMVGSVPFGVDYPNHAARLFVECNLGDPVLSRMYTVEYDLIPNLAIDLINRPLCGLVEPLTLVRGAMIATLAGVLVMVWKLHRLLNDGEPNAFVLLAPAMTFNIVTSMGYLNYFIGTFLFLVFVWCMLKYRVLERHKALAILLPNLFGAALFLCHVFALALAGVFLFGLRFGAASGRPLLKRTLDAGLMTAASFVVPFLMMLTAERSGFGLNYAPIGKLRTFLAPMLYSSIYEALFVAFIWVALFYWAFREKKIFLVPALFWPVVFLMAFSFSLPSALLDAVDLDSRSLVSVAYLAITAVRIRTAVGKSALRETKAEIAAAVVAALTLSSQLLVAVPQIRTFEQQAAEFRAALKIIEPASPVVSILNTDRTPRVPKRFYVHLTSYLTLDQRAFNPSEFTGKGMQPMLAKPAFACIDIPAGSPLRLNIARRLLEPETAEILKQRRYTNYRYFYRWDRRFDYVIYYHHGARGNPFPTILKPVHQGSFFTIFRTAKPLRPNGPCA
jgi:hypothetical protein